MIKHFSSRPHLFIAVLVIVTASLLFLILHKEQASGPVDSSEMNLEEMGQSIAKQELVARYEAQSSQLVGRYLARREAVPMSSELSDEEVAAWQDFLASLKLDLLDLRVPPEYRNLHLQLIVTFDYLEEGVRGDFGLVEEREEKLSQLVAEYPWLTQ